MIVNLLSAVVLAATAQPVPKVAPNAATNTDVRVAAEAPPLYELGGDVLRFRAAPALGGKAYVIEVHRVSDGSAEGEGVWLEGHPRLGWTRTGTTRIKLTAAQYAGLTTEVDQALAPPPASPRKTDEIVICTDGPGWFTERKRQDMVWTLSGFCGSDHPNKHIAQAMQRLFPEHEF